MHQYWWQISNIDANVDIAIGGHGVCPIIGTFTVSQIWESLHAFSFATKCKQISQRMEVFKVRASLTLLKSLAIVKYYLITFIIHERWHFLCFIFFCLGSFSALILVFFASDMYFLIGGQTNVYIHYDITITFMYNIHNRQCLFGKRF